MATICKVDSQLVYEGVSAKSADAKAAIPKGYILTDPPKGEGIYQWAGKDWKKLDKYPPKPEPPPPPTPATKEELIARLRAENTYDAWQELIKDGGKVAVEPK